MPSLISSFKFGHSLATVGSLIQDRSAGDHRRHVAASPDAAGDFFDPSRRPAQSDAAHRDDSASALDACSRRVVASQAVSVTASDVADAVVRIDSTLKGPVCAAQTDRLSARVRRLFWKNAGELDGIRQLQEVLGNPIEPVKVESLDISVELISQTAGCRRGVFFAAVG